MPTRGENGCAGYAVEIGMLFGLLYGLIRGAFFRLTLDYISSPTPPLFGGQHLLVAAYLLAFYIPLGAVLGALGGWFYLLSTAKRTPMSRVAFWQCVIWGIVLLRFGWWLNMVRLLDYWALRVAVGPLNLRSALVVPAVWISNTVLAGVVAAGFYLSMQFYRARARETGAHAEALAPLLCAQLAAVDGYALCVFELHRLLRGLFPAPAGVLHMLIVLFFASLGVEVFVAARVVIRRWSAGGCAGTRAPLPHAAVLRAVLLGACILGLCHLFFVQRDRRVLFMVHRKSAVELQRIIGALDRLTDFDGDGYSLVGIVKDVSPFDPARYLPAVPLLAGGTGGGGDTAAAGSGPPVTPEGAHPLVDRARKLSRRGELNIVLVLVDSLRADRMGFMGNARNATPGLDALSREATVFTRAYVNSSFTKTSVPSILLSVPPSVHRAYYYDPQGLPRVSRSVSLVETLRAAGYQTALVSAFKFDTTVLKPAGIDGFGTVVDLAPLSIFRTRTQRMMRKFYRMPARLVREQFFGIRDGFGYGNAFFYLHFCEPHPYSDPLPEPYRGLFGDLPGGEVFVSPTEADLAYMMLLYDRRLAYLDSEIVELIDRLKAEGAWDRTVFILSADHGDKVGEHGGLFHGSTLYEEEVHVPLLIRLPGQQKGVVTNQLVQSMDIMPTVLDLAGIATPPTVRGASLAPLLGGEYRGELHREIFLENSWRRETFTLGIIRGEWKYTYNFFTGEEQLFNLAADPREREDLSCRRADVRNELKRALFRSAEENKPRQRSDSIAGSR